MAMINQVIQPLKETAVAVQTLQQQAGRVDVETDGGYGAPRRQEVGSATGAYPRSKREEEVASNSPPKPPRVHSGQAHWDVGAGWFQGEQKQQQTTGGQRYRHQTGDNDRRNSAEGLRGPERRVEAHVKENPPETWDDLKKSLMDRFRGIGGEFERRRALQDRLTCWNCGQTDHGFSDCPSAERKIFCYRCGKPEVVTPSCPVCAGNARTSVAQERMQRYFEARNRIFNNHQLDGMRTVSRRLLKARKRFRQRHQTRRAVVEAVRRGMGSDPRVFAEVLIQGKRVTGLLDTGASVNVLGRGSRELLEEIGVRMEKYVSIVKTAAGEDRSIIGRVHVPVQFKGVEKVLTFYVCPYLEQAMYLGIDFWRRFALAPAILGEMPAQNPEASVSELWDAKIPWLDGKAIKESVIEEWDLQQEEKERLEAVKREFLAFEDVGLGRTSVEKHRIQLMEGAEPFKDRHYPLSPAMQEIVWAEVDKMLKLGVIEVSESPWSNRTTVVELDLESCPYTAFTVAGRPLYQFAMMPFGLCNAAQRLCRLMDQVIPAQLRSNVFVYLDDLLIISPDFDTHMKYLSLVAECLGKANLTIGLKKSKFCFKTLKYLGFIIGGGTLRMDPERIVAIQKIPEPKSVKELRSFLGTAGWYRPFIKDFAAMATPLTDALKKGRTTRLVLGEEAKSAIQALKNALTSAPCDASHLGVGAVLFQYDEDKKTEKECLAAVLAIERFRPYVGLMPFTVITDHASLKWLMTMKDLSGRLARWSLRLQSFDFETSHRKGADNVVADTLSRCVEEPGTHPGICHDGVPICRI
nr:uncharacterized protein LOC121502206 [Drosophila kikkawai]